MSLMDVLLYLNKQIGTLCVLLFGVLFYLLYKEQKGTRYIREKVCVRLSSSGVFFLQNCVSHFF